MAEKIYMLQASKVANFIGERTGAERAELDHALNSVLGL